MVLGPGSALEDMLAEKLDRHRDHDDQNKLSSKVLVMQPILRFLQLLCENHNQNLQVSPKKTLVFSCILIKITLNVLLSTSMIV